VPQGPDVVPGPTHLAAGLAEPAKGRFYEHLVTAYVHRVDRVLERRKHLPHVVDRRAESLVAEARPGFYGVWRVDPRHVRCHERTGRIHVITVDGLIDLPDYRGVLL